MAVFVLDKHKRPLMPCSEKRARLLVGKDRAKVHRRHPFTIRMVDRDAGEPGMDIRELTLKLDPGSKFTGVAIVRLDDQGTTHVVQKLELAHRGDQISRALATRSKVRGRRRARLRFRPKRSLNRRRRPGSLPPSLMHRVDSTLTWVGRLRALAPIRDLQVESVLFDSSARTEEDVVEHASLAAFELRERVLDHWGRECVYCGAKGVRLQMEHVVPRARGGSDRMSNRLPSCEPCNRTKGARNLSDFLRDRPGLLTRIEARLLKPSRDAAAVNTTRLALKTRLEASGLPLSLWSGARTKWNRSRLGMPKSHANDAACVGKVTAISGCDAPTLLVTCTGRGRYRRTLVDAHGFRRGEPMTRHKRIRGLSTGDMVRAVVTRGRRRGVWVGRMAIRADGDVVIRTRHGEVWTSATRCRVLQRADGHGYAVIGI